jgi:alpha-L-arabinofuranosidase
MKKIFESKWIKVYSTVLIVLLMLTGFTWDSQKPLADKVSAKLKAVVHADQTGVPIHRYTYGMFTELLSNLFEKGIWAEMLSDRKFYYPVNSSETLIPKNSRPGFNRWRPIGPDGNIIMDKFNPYVGEQSVRVHLDKLIPHGIQQSGLGLGAGRKYNGYIILCGEPGVKVTVRLLWGINPGDSQTVSFQSLAKEFKKYPFSFTSGATINEGRLEITGTGSGDFFIGAVSLMPADNIKGFRADMVGLLKELNSGIYRWPGGNMLAGYDWRDGIGDRDKRATRYDLAWNCIEPNDVGTDEFIILCDLLKVDPYMMVNIGFGDARSAGELVEYCNGSKDTPMGKIRAANGYPEPNNVKTWGIGNEMYGEWQLGHMGIDHYIMKHKMFADSMRKVDPTIKIVACGATLYEINTTNRYHRLFPVEKIPYQYGSPEDWSGNLLSGASDYMDYLSEHVYVFYNHAYDAAQQKFVLVQDSLPERVRKASNRIKGAAEAMHEYVRRIPELKDKNITFFLDEWVSGSRGFEGTLGVALGMHEIFRNTDVYTMSGFTSFASNVSWNANEAVYTSIGLFFKVYREKFGIIPLTISGNSPQKEVMGTVLVDKPEKPSGSDTYPLDVMAALSADRKKMTLSIINPTFTEQEISISFEGITLNNGCNINQIKSPSLKAENIVGERPEINVVNSRLKTTPGTFSIAPLSITLYEMSVAN